MDKQSFAIKINKNLRRRKICHTIAFILFIMQFVLEIFIVGTILISNNIEIIWTWKTIDLLFKWIMLYAVILGSILDGILKRRYILAPNGDIEDFNPIPQKELNTVLCSLIFCSPYIIAGLAVLLGFGGTYGLASLPMVVGHIFYIIAYVNMKKYNKMFNADKAEQEQKNIKKMQAEKLLAKTGKVFFINYYNQLKKHNTIDIIDVIQETYSEKSKKVRISNAKRIFSRCLQIDALKVVLQNEDGVANQEIIKKAESILGMEITEQLILVERKRKEKEEKSKREEIIPNCSICRYYINEKTCEVWVKKPAETCEEFRIKKHSAVYSYYFLDNDKKCNNYAKSVFFNSEMNTVERCKELFDKAESLLNSEYNDYMFGIDLQGNKRPLASKNNDKVKEVLDGSIDLATAAYLSIDDVIVSPWQSLKKSLQIEIINKYKEVTPYTTFLFLNDYYKKHNLLLVVYKGQTTHFGEQENYKSDL